MEIQSIGAYKGSPRKALYSFRQAEEGVVDNKKRESSGQRSELVRSTADGDVTALSFNKTVSFGERKAIGPIKSSLAKENNQDSFVSRGGVYPKDISDKEKMLLFTLNFDTQSVADQNMIGKVTLDMTGYAINKYREAGSYRRREATTLEVYA
ncbi:MAG: hypothetical protein C0399_04740 [Syntrophus sp. (in: bacteria)]|nr:hypothetical protein [Syntrophus sp. (in: bacteria)]